MTRTNPLNPASPDEWSRRLDAINPAYRPWAASFIWWQNVDIPAPKLSRMKPLDITQHKQLWNDFKQREVPADINPNLDRDTLDAALEIIGFKEAAMTVAIRKAARQRVKNRTKKTQEPIPAPEQEEK